MNRNCLKTGIQKMHCAHIDHFKDAWPAWHEPEQFTTSYQQCSEVRMFEKDPKIGPFWFPHIPRPVYGSFFVCQSLTTFQRIEPWPRPFWGLSSCLQESARLRSRWRAGQVVVQASPRARMPGASTKADQRKAARS